MIKMTCSIFLIVMDDVSSGFRTMIMHKIYNMIDNHDQNKLHHIILLTVMVDVSALIPLIECDDEEDFLLMSTL